ncbi:Cu(I)-responsive transcriptional regulator [Hoeflea alexandrii]|uniref:Cu(I)-responsive transcriptional regulator n=1 Tax=Hoeflea alexandrii TaxID=288436 RepID=UPI0022AECB3E|nr:Cu(I)-responsive transcriptional regulator [Hoeflea alexandrii]MCZ4292032.1 Cu(I)-responsive transcriptional regulator [Hoeflea alexandrii]
MNISEAADATSLPAKTIRYYEDIGLIKPARATNGYRDYDGNDVHRLAFIQRSRSLGFTIDECRSLLSLYEDTERASSDVKALALEKIGEIDRKLKELKSLRNTLKTLADHCHGDDRPDCPIIDEIAGRSRV